MLFFFSVGRRPPAARDPSSLPGVCNPPPCATPPAPPILTHAPQVPRVKYVIWNKDCSCVALLSKHGIIIATRELEQLCAVSETVRVKSGAWDVNNRTFIYTTLNHVKYCLPNGDVGIIRTLDAPVYVTKAHNKQLFCLDRECKTRALAIDNTEVRTGVSREDLSTWSLHH
jgi:coatomer protein complex subunit alpha (xenin)